MINSINMKHLITIITLLFSINLAVSAQHAKADRIIGTYMTEGDKGKVVISKNGNVYNGKLVWSITPGALDKHNPVPAERTKKLAGKNIITGFQYTDGDVWEKGKIYDPESGKTYKCKITMKPNGDLIVRGFIGISLLGRNTEWKRAK
ncbi:hypothetical protein HMPREF3034_02299 [Prevotella sp. DNF00663]|nr:hypothetical protein HMPREF3034_02299 [Prevotella sp. DNF00663]